MRDVENLDHKDHQYLQTQLARLAALRLHLGAYLPCFEVQKPWLVAH